MDNERTIAYINSLEMGDRPELCAVARRARESFVPILRPETASLLKTLMELHKPMRVLEVGTAVGYSALLMADHLPEGGHITTIENWEKRIPIARENFKALGREEVITLLEGDAQKILPTLEGPFDLIFMDAAKGQYITFLPEVMRLLRAGGLLVSDNVLSGGDIIESRFAVERRDRTIHSRMREYLYELKHRPELSSSILPVGDGVALTVKLFEANEE